MKNINPLQLKFLFIQEIRNFFNQRGLLDVMTPPLQSNPGMEVHIHPFQARSIHKNKNLDLFLHTSPEFMMKEYLSKGLENIYTLTYSFRDEPESEIHRPQFIMLEWYRTHAHYTKIMEDTEQLVQHMIHFLDKNNFPINSQLINQKVEQTTVQEIMQEYCKFDILNFLDTNDLKQKIYHDFKQVPISLEENFHWDDYFFLLFLNVIEPELEKIPMIILKEYPHHLSALSTLKESDPRVCERFEMYIQGVEICNCFNELRDIEIQLARFERDSLIKQDLYKYALPTPKTLINALKTGFPPTAGNALGVERLLQMTSSTKNVF